MNRFGIVIVFILIALFNIQVVNAAKPAISTLKPSQVKAEAKIKVNAKLTKDERLVNITFDKTQNINSINYTLTYESNNIKQGMVESFNPNDASKVFKTVYLGTCSAHSCMDHLNPKNIELEVSGFYNSGKFFSLSKKVH